MPRYTVYPIRRADDRHQVEFKTVLYSCDDQYEAVEQAIIADGGHPCGVIVVDEMTGKAWTPSRQGPPP